MFNESHVLWLASRLSAKICLKLSLRNKSNECVLSVRRVFVMIAVIVKKVKSNMPSGRLDFPRERSGTYLTQEFNLNAVIWTYTYLCTNVYRSKTDTFVGYKTVTVFTNFTNFTNSISLSSDRVNVNECVERNGELT